MRYGKEVPDDSLIKEVIEQIYNERPTDSVKLLDSRV